MSAQKLKTLIFDLGGVIINLDQPATLKAFEALVTAKDVVLPQNFNYPAFLDYETGNMDDATFRKAVRDAYRFEADVEEQHLDEAWNTMLLDIPKERVQLLKDLRKEHTLYLLSNTNPIHIVKVNETLEEQHGVTDLAELFDKVYYSYEMNMRKPDLEIFEFVLRENNLNPEETLFIDDNEDNIRGAGKLNIQTLHVTGPHTLFEYFSNDKK